MQLVFPHGLQHEVEIVSHLSIDGELVDTDPTESRQAGVHCGWLASSA